MNKLYFTIGVPCSGKSTLVDNMVREIQISDVNLAACYNPYDKKTTFRLPSTVSIVCADDIRKAISGNRWNSHVEEHVQAIKHTMIKALLERGNVIVDGTHTTWKSINKLLEITTNAFPIWVFKPLTNTMDKWYEHEHECIERAISTGQKDLIPIIKRMVQNLITLNNNFDSEFKIAQNVIKAGHRIA